MIPKTEPMDGQRDPGFSAEQGEEPDAVDPWHSRVLTLDAGVTVWKLMDKGAPKGR